jgi:hypothetical protein
MHIKSSTSKVILLAVAPDEKGVLRAADDGLELPGLHFNVDVALPIGPQLQELFATQVELPGAERLDLDQEFAARLPDDGGDMTLYLGRVELKEAASEAWATIPALLRRMHADRRRLPFLRAWQMLSGGLKMDSKAIESGDLRKLLDPDT